MKLIGNARLGRNAEVRKTSNGKAVANLALAFDYGQKDSEGKKPTQWVDAALWGDQAERLAPYLLKGTVLFLTLRDVHTEKFEGSNGPGFKLVGTVAEIEFTPKQRERSEAEINPAPRPDPKPSAASMADFEDDIPF